MLELFKSPLYNLPGILSITPSLSTELLEHFRQQLLPLKLLDIFRPIALFLKPPPPQAALQTGLPDPRGSAPPVGSI